MARQIVSYDDLAPSDIPVQTTSPILTTSPSKQEAADGTGSVSPSRKRRRDEGVSEDKVTRNVDMDSNNVHEDGVKVTSGNLSSSQSLPRRPQVKKRGKNKRHFGGGGSGIGMAAVAFEAPHKQATVPPVMQHWDDPGIQADGISYDENNAEVNGTGDHLDAGNQANGEEGEAEMDLEETEYVNEDEDEDEDDEDENRDLTHEEIWDDSALIAAWDAANEEYEAIHGKNKRWKKERIHRSPLWYNIPPEKPKASLNKGKGKAKRSALNSSSTVIGASEAYSSVPLNFETYVPTHDPSLAFPTPPSPPLVPEPTQAQLRSITSQYSSMLPASVHINSSGSGGTSTSANLAAVGAAGISADEAFSRALGAMYWCGYWTAVYNVQRAHEQGTTVTTNNLEAEDSTEVQEEEETVELAPAQH